MRLVPNSQGTDVDTTNQLAEDRIPQRRRIVGALDPVPRAFGEPIAGGEPGVDQLAQRGHLTGGRVDEEPTHCGGG